MKVLIFSDSHNTTYYMTKIIEIYKNQIDVIIHLGDCVEDLDIIKEDYKIPVYQVKGNNDRFDFYPLSQIASICGVKFYLTHGHKERVYYDIDTIFMNAVREECSIALFGHTHAIHMELYEGILIINPGSISYPRDGARKTFAIVDVISPNEISAEIYGYENNVIQILKSKNIKKQ